MSTYERTQQRAELLAWNAANQRAREAYRFRDVALFEDCLDPRCGPTATCRYCRARARRLIISATSEAECADLLAIIDRPGLRVLAGCGSDAGYHAHRRHKTRICRPCLDAHNRRCGP